MKYPAARSSTSCIRFRALNSAITSAIGTLKGPSHGGANVEVMNMLREIDESGEDPGEWVRGALDGGKKIMGFGHRVYKAVDPRATVLRELADKIMQEAGETRWLDLSDKIRGVMAEEMEAKGKKIYPNVDFFSASGSSFSSSTRPCSCSSTCRG